MTNRERYNHLLDTYGITQAKSAKLISAVTGRPCAARTVRSWLNDPEKVSSKASGPPDWAVDALEKSIAYMKRALAERQAAAAAAQDPAQEA